MRCLPLALALAFLHASPVLAQEITIGRDLAYGPEPHALMDVYTPVEVTDETPVLVFFFGGGWQMGSKEALGSLGQDLARSGVIFVAPIYRLWPEVTFPAFLDDCTAALAHVAGAMPRADGTPRALFVGGWSAGAYNALAVALDQDRLAARGIETGAISGAIGLAGPYSGGLCAGQPCPEVFPADSKADRPVARLVESGDPPLLLLAAERDSYVDIGQFETIRDAAEAAGLHLTAQVIPGSSHNGLLRHLSVRGTQERTVLDGFLTAHSR